MPISNTFDFYVPEARRLADLVGINADIHSVMELVRTFLSYQRDNSIREHWQRRALCVASLTTYGRTFGKGVRDALPVSLVQQLGSEWLDTHRYFKDLRDKWAAHSSNNFEESGVTIQAHIDEQGFVHVSSIGERHKNTSILSVSDMRRLGELCERLQHVVSGEIAREKDRLLQIVRDMDLSVLASNPAAFAIPSAPERHSKQRPRYGS